jgi:hypothetical protein
VRALSLEGEVAPSLHEPELALAPEPFSERAPPYTTDGTILLADDFEVVLSALVNANKNR